MLLRSSVLFPLTGCCFSSLVCCHGSVSRAGRPLGATPSTIAHHKHVSRPNIADASHRQVRVGILHSLRRTIIERNAEPGYQSRSVSRSGHLLAAAGHHDKSAFVHWTIALQNPRLPPRITYPCHPCHDRGHGHARRRPPSLPAWWRSGTKCSAARGPRSPRSPARCEPPSPGR